MAKLSADEIRLLRDALLDTYDRASFEELLELRLDRRLEHIAPGQASLREEVLSVINAAEDGDAEQRWTVELLQAAAAERPSNVHLQNTVRKLLKRVAAPEERPDCPYPGMKPFDAADARFFYGREQEIDEMLRRLRSGQRLLFVVGPSGSGKSSLINAGALPNLAKSKLFAPGYWLVRTMRPGADPITALAEALGGDSTRPDEAVAALLAAHPPAERLLLVIDQFEELFSLAEPDERRDFIAALHSLRDAEACTLLLAMRADFYPDLMDSDLWQTVSDQRMDVVPLRGDALEEAIVKPAEQRNVRVEPALVERLMADAAGEPGVLPMLQQTLVLLWAQMADRRLTLDAYEELRGDAPSGLAVAIGAHADAKYGELTAEQKATAQRILLRLIQFGEGRPNTRRQQPEGALRAGLDVATFTAVLRHLTDNRLLTLSGGEDGGERRVDISHEALIKGWPKLQEWVKKWQEGELARRRLEAKAQEWIRLGRGGGGLLDAAELKEITTWMADPSIIELGVSDDFSALVTASQRAINPGWHRLGTVGLLSGIISIAMIVVTIYVSLRLAGISPANWYAVRLFLGLVTLGLILVVWQVARQDPRFLPRLTHFIADHRNLQAGIGSLCMLAVLIGFTAGLEPLRHANSCKALGYGTSPDSYEAAVINENIDPAKAEMFAWVLGSTSKGLLMIHRATTSDAAPIDCENFLRYRIWLTQTVEPGATVSEMMYRARVEDIQTQETKIYLAAGIGDKCGLILDVAYGVAESLNFIRSRKPDYNDPAVAADNCAPYLAFQKAMELRDRGEYIEAKQEFEQAAASFEGYGKSTSFLTDFAYTCYGAGDLECARQKWETVIRLDPHYTLAYQNLSVIQRKLGDYEAAEFLLEQAEVQVRADTDEAEQRYQEYLLDKNRGLLALDRHQYDIAKGFLQSALGYEAEIQGRQSFREEILYHLATSAEMLQKPDEACTYWRQYRGSVSNQLVGEQERRKDAENHIRNLGCR